MSRQRQTTVVWWRDGDGVRHEHRLVTRDDAPLRDIAPPRNSWLVEVFDPAKHLVPVLTANAGQPPLVYAARSDSATFVLLEDGLAGAFVTRDTDEPHPVVAPVGTPREHFPVWCPLCRAEWPLDAVRLHSKRGPKPGKPGRFTVGAPHSA